VQSSKPVSRPERNESLWGTNNTRIQLTLLYDLFYGLELIAIGAWKKNLKPKVVFQIHKEVFFFE